LKLLSALLAMTLAASAPQAAFAARAAATIKVSNWRTDCHPGTDEFALDCKAVASAGGFRFILETTASQLFLSIDAPRCGGLTGVGDRHWFRYRLVEMSRAGRRAAINAAFHKSVKALAVICPGMDDLKFSFRGAPDIAVWPTGKPSPARRR
jgi:hypothetical protein